jgi:hypothetical protein
MIRAMPQFEGSKADHGLYLHLTTQAQADAETAALARDLAHVSASIAVKLGATPSAAARAIGGTMASDEELRKLRLKYQSIQGRGRDISRVLARSYDKGALLIGAESKIDWTLFNDPAHRSKSPNYVEHLLKQASVFMRLYRLQPRVAHTLGIEELTLDWLIFESNQKVKELVHQFAELENQMQALYSHPSLINPRRATRPQLRHIATELDNASRRSIEVTTSLVSEMHRLLTLYPLKRDNSIRWAVFLGAAPSDVAAVSESRYSLRSIYKLRHTMGTSPDKIQAANNLRKIQDFNRLIRSATDTEKAFIKGRLTAIENRFKVKRLIETHINPAIAM